jgi:hypothetical protein
VFLELASRALSDLEEWPKGTGREERVAVPPKDSHRAAPLVAKAPQERRLADSCLAAEEHDPPASFCYDGREAVMERGELPRALEQLARILRCAGSRSMHFLGALVAPVTYCTGRGQAFKAPWLCGLAGNRSRGVVCPYLG